MKILALFGFIVFFGLGVPAFLYWFSRFSKDLMSKELPFIGFPEDHTNPSMSPQSRLPPDDN